MMKVPQHIYTIQAITEIAMAHTSLPELLSNVLHGMVAALRVDSASILLLSANEQYLSRMTSYGVNAALSEESELPLGYGVAGKITSTRQPVIIDDLSTTEVVRPLRSQHLRSLAAVPLRIEDRLIGVLHVDSKQTHYFTESDIQLLQLVAAPIALAIDHAHLLAAAHRAQQEAMAHVRELEAIFEAMTDGVAVFDRHGVPLQMNAVAREILGVGQDQPRHVSLAALEPQLLISDMDGQLLSFEHHPLPRILRGEVLTGMHAADHYLTGMDGRKHLVTSSGTPLRNEHGQIVGAVLILRDITLRHALEQRTHSSLNALLEMAQTLVGDASIVLQPHQSKAQTQHLVDLARQIMNCSHATLLAFTTDPESLSPQMVGVTSATESFSPDHLLRSPLGDWFTAAQLVELQASNAIQIDEIRDSFLELVVDPAGSSCLLAPIVVQRHLIGVFALSHNIPNHRFSAKEIALATGVARFAALVIEREQLLQERETAAIALHGAQEANRMKTLFLANMSHELRTPLTGVLGGAELLQRQMLGPLNPEQEEYMGDILSSARHLLQLINDILDLTKIEAGKMQFFPEIMQLAQVVNEACDVVRIMAVNKKITFEHWVDPTLSAVILDPAKFKQVLFNYLSNGIKFTPEGGRVKLQILPDAAATFRVEVIDTGIGIAPAELTQLFVPFQQLDAGTTKRYAGTGLGLALTKQIVEAQGGSVGVTSTPGVGSRFWATFPAVNWALITAQPATLRSCSIIRCSPSSASRSSPSR